VSDLSNTVRGTRSVALPARKGTTTRIAFGRPLRQPAAEPIIGQPADAATSDPNPVFEDFTAGPWHSLLRTDSSNRLHPRAELDRQRQGKNTATRLDLRRQISRPP
jgi:hypothetical protein